MSKRSRVVCSEPVEVVYHIRIKFTFEEGLNQHRPQLLAGMSTYGRDDWSGRPEAYYAIATPALRAVFKFPGLTPYIENQHWCIAVASVKAHELARVLLEFPVVIAALIPTVLDYYDELYALNRATVPKRVRE